MATVVPRIYASIADLQMTPYISYAEFRKQLLWNLLFGGNLVVMDGFFWASPYVIADVMSGPEKSLILSGLDLGVVQPIFRENVGGSFVEAFSVFRGQGIVGATDDADRCVRALETARQAGFRKYAPRHWPSALVGKGFLEEVRASFSRDSDSSWSANERRIWGATNVWRSDCVDEALHRTDDGSLRRGELFDVVARRAGWTQRRPPANAAEILKGASTPYAKSLLRAFMLWANQCYQKNQASMFRIWSSALTGPGYARLALLPPGRSESPIDGIRMMEYSALVPSPHILERMTPSSVLAVRTSTEAREYFTALNQWHNSPGPSERADLGKALREYTSKLRVDYVQGIQSKLKTLVYGLNDSPGSARRQLVDSALGLVGLHPEAGPAIYLGKHAWTYVKTRDPDLADFAKDVVHGARVQRVRLSIGSKRARPMVATLLSEAATNGM